MHIRGLKAALNASGRFEYTAPEVAVDHLVVGGGVVGLAIARLLAREFPHKTTYLVERNETAGQETSSRNSEVIHAGLYYPANSFKAALCIRGRNLLYDYCQANAVPFKKIGKLVVALPHQQDYLRALHTRTRRMAWPLTMDVTPSTPAVPTKLISGDEARSLEPDLSPDIVSALVSQETGIVDSHTLIQRLEQDVADADNAEAVFASRVVRVDPYEASQEAFGTPDIAFKENGWVVQVQTGDTSSSETNSIFARILINASGLSANLILNSLLSDEERIPMFFARGSYCSYNGPGVENVKHLLYPCPDADKTGHAFQALGTHLTLDLSGRIKFGPDLQWLSPGGPALEPHQMKPTQSTTDNHEHELDYSYDEADIDFWKQHLVPDEKLDQQLYNSVRTYLPGIDSSKLRPDYVGIRPKLVPPWGGFQDFVFRMDHSESFTSESTSTRRHSGQMISLLAIESPGLTSCLSIAEEVVKRLKNSSPTAYK